MDYSAYHNAINRGYSEREATRIGEDAWENSLHIRHQDTPYQEPTDLDFVRMGVLRMVSNRRARYLRRKGAPVWLRFFSPPMALRDNVKGDYHGAEILSNRPS